MLHRDTCAGLNRVRVCATMKATSFQHESSTARMASGMTSRARRPESHIFAG